MRERENERQRKRERARERVCERYTHAHTHSHSETLHMRECVRACVRAGGYRRAICVMVMGLGTVLVSLITAVATGFLTFDPGQHQLFIVAHVLLSPPPPLSPLSPYLCVFSPLPPFSLPLLGSVYLFMRARLWATNPS